MCTQERYCENRVCIREIEEQLPQSRREREREIVRDKRLSRRERLIGVAIGSKGLRPSILISIIVGPRWNPLSNLSLFLPPSTSTRTPAGHRNYASFHRCYSSLIQIMLRSITEREREGEKVRFIRNSRLEEEVTGSMRVIFSRIREKGWGNFMGRGNLIQNSLQLTPFNRRESWNREREREEFRERYDRDRFAFPLPSTIVSFRIIFSTTFSILFSPDHNSHFNSTRNFDQLSVNVGSRTKGNRSWKRGWLLPDRCKDFGRRAYNHSLNTTRTPSRGFKLGNYDTSGVTNEIVRSRNFHFPRNRRG